MPLAKQKDLLVKLAISLEKVWSEEGLLRCFTSTIASRRITLILLGMPDAPKLSPTPGERKLQDPPHMKGGNVQHHTLEDYNDGKWGCRGFQIFPKVASNYHPQNNGGWRLLSYWDRNFSGASC